MTLPETELVRQAEIDEARLDHPPMESGEVIRVQMPRSSLIALGLPMDVERAHKSVKADLLIGEDGQARAIRFVR